MRLTTTQLTIEESTYLDADECLGEPDDCTLAICWKSSGGSLILAYVPFPAKSMDEICLYELNQDYGVIIMGHEAVEYSLTAREISPIFDFGISCYAIGAQTAYFADNLRIVCVGLNQRWTSNRVAYDGIEDLRLDGDRVLALGWSAPRGSMVPVAVNRSDGKVLSSAYP